MFSKASVFSWKWRQLLPFQERYASKEKEPENFLNIRWWEEKVFLHLFLLPLVLLEGSCTTPEHLPFWVGSSFNLRSCLIALLLENTVTFWHVTVLANVKIPDSGQNSMKAACIRIPVVLFNYLFEFPTLLKACVKLFSSSNWMESLQSGKICRIFNKLVKQVLKHWVSVCLPRSVSTSSGSIPRRELYFSYPFMTMKLQGLLLRLLWSVLPCFPQLTVVNVVDFIHEDVLDLWFRSRLTA